MTNNLSDSELCRISGIISIKTGLSFPPEKYSSLINNLKSASGEFGFKDLNSFKNWLLSASLTGEQVQTLACHIIVPETYFWREPRVFTALQDLILPALVKEAAKKKRTIFIWSAGCSTGEEPYSIAIALHRAFPNREDLRISIIATDINEKALIKARRGIYGNWSFRNTPSWFRELYFRPVNEKDFEILPSIREMVSFHHSNLVETGDLPGIPAGSTIDLIFCRNVLMYFTRDWAEKLSARFCKLISDKGLLAVAACELSSGLFPEFTTVNFRGSVLFRKKSKENEIKSKPDLKFKFKPIVTRILSTSEPPKKPLLNPQPDPVMISNAKKTYDKDLLLTRDLAGKRDLEDALTACNKMISDYRLDAPLYFLRASIYQDMGKNQEAIKSLKQAVYADPDYIMGHFTLANLYFQQGNKNTAEKYYRNAISLLSSKSNNEIPEGSDGMSVNQIRQIVRRNLEKVEKK